MRKKREDLLLLVRGENQLFDLDCAMVVHYSYLVSLSQWQLVFLKKYVFPVIQVEHRHREMKPKVLSGI